MADLEDMMGGVFDLFDDASEAVVFQMDEVPVSGHWTSGNRSVKLATSGGGQVFLRGTLVVRRSVFTSEPAIGTKLTDEDGTAFRIHDVAGDAVSWTLTLTTPNARH